MQDWHFIVYKIDWIRCTCKTKLFLSFCYSAALYCTSEPSDCLAGWRL